MAGNAAIWRADTLGAEASNQSDIIEFDLNAVVPNSTAHIRTTEVEFDIEPAENERAVGNISELQALGVQAVPITIAGHIQTPSSTTVTQIIKNWAFGNQVNANFPKGRFGLRMDDNPIVNLVPTSTLGYLISNIRLIRPVEFTGKLDSIMILRFNGDPNTSDFDWS